LLGIFDRHVLRGIICIENNFNIILVATIYLMLVWFIICNYIIVNKFKPYE
jgi:hypothetical protein